MSDKQNTKREYSHEFINFMQTIKKDKYQKLDFDRKMLICVDINLNAINHFKKCRNLKELPFFDKLPEKFKSMSEEDRVKKPSEECLDLLGVYISPQNDDRGNIFLSKEKIDKVAIEYNIEFDAMYNFVKIHEYAHAAMCPKLSKYEKCNIDKNSASYELIEESLATAVALKRMKNIPDYDKLEKFVMNQPTQYRYGLDLLNKYEKNIENIMIIWKLSKCLEQNEFDTEDKDFNSWDEVFVLFYTLTDNELFLSQEAKDIFLF